MAVDLVEAEDDGPAGLLAARSRTCGRPGRSASVTSTSQSTRSHLAEALHGRVHHALVHAVHAACGCPGVSKSTICAAGAVDHGQDAVARGLGLVGDDRDLLADQPVDERGLAHVGPADHGDEAGAEGRRWLAHAGLTPAHHRLAPEAHAVDALAARRPHLDREAPVVGALARPRDAAEDGGHQAAHGVHVLAVRQRGLQRLLQPVDVTRPATSTRRPPPPRWARASTSYSSLISPTSSSTMSSTVTSPAVPPYSSMTTAKVMRPRLQLLQQLRDLLGLRHQEGRAHQRLQRARSAALVLDAGRARRPRPRCRRGSRRRRARGCTWSRASAGAGRPRVAVAGMATMSGRGVITSRTSVSAKRATRVHQPALVGVVHRRRAAPRAPAVGRRPRPRRRLGAARLRSARHQRRQRARVEVEDGQQQEQRPLGVPAHEGVGQRSGGRAAGRRP